MKNLPTKVEHDFTRELYWARIKFVADDDNIESNVFAASSREYIEDTYEVGANQGIQKSHLDDWLGKVIAKWSQLGPDLFKQDAHFDIYAETKTGEANALDFLLGKAKSG